MRNLMLFLTLTLATAPAMSDSPLVINANASLPEGPLVRDGNLLYVEFGADTVDRWDGKTTTVFWRQPGCGPTAIVPFGKGYVISCYQTRQIVQVSAQGKTLAAFAKDDGGGPLIGPNDGTPDGNGGMYFTTYGPADPSPIAGRVLHMRADGLMHEVARDLQSPNGIALAPDHKSLFVAESEAGRILSFSVAPDGSLTNRRVFVRLYRSGEAMDVYPDGIKFGPDGNLYVGEFSAGRILKLDAEGKTLRVITVPAAGAPNLAFSSDGKTMYVMAVDDKTPPKYRGKVYAIPMADNGG